MKTVAHSLFLAFVASAMVLVVGASQNEPIGRALLDTSSVPVSSGTSTAVPTTTQDSTTSATTPSSTSANTPSSSSSPSSSSAAASKTDSSSPAASTSATTNGGSTSATPSHVVTTSAVATTDSSGQVFTSYVEVTATESSTPSPSQTPNNASSDSGGLSTGSIVGLSVSGGIAALGIILFFVWKFTRKRFADFDDNEAIKWPELNAHNNDVHALPTHSTGRAGFGPENDSDLNLTRAPSPGAYANSITASSIPEGHGDPYAVPPLPHLNPNQPYHDEPGYYDPYRGPVPNTFADTMSDGHGTEAIPMTRMRSPAPQMAYDMQGRASPAPQAAMGYEERSMTPTPLGRASPSPYGYGPR